MFSCASKLDGKEYELNAFKTHLAKNGVSQKDYCTNIAPKFCLATKKKLEFKSLEYYLFHDFDKSVGQPQIVNWYKENKDIAKDYALFLLYRRKILKPYEWALSQTELKSLNYPNINYYNYKFGSYNKVNESIDLKFKYQYDNIALSFKDDFLIQIDTREKQPFSFDNSKIKKLDYGDYKCSTKPNLAIERKSLPDLINTFVGDFDRVEREIERSVARLGSLIVLCENDISTALDFHNSYYMKEFTKINSSVLFHNIRLLIQKYSNVQFGFCNNREHMKEVMLKIFGCEQDILQYDVQYLIMEKYL
jgi:hypothetical protein